VTFYEPSYSNWDNANELIENLISGPSVFSDNPTMKKVTVAGIEADYLKSYEQPDTSTKQHIARLAVFDYAGMIWTISMSTYSTYPESSDIQESFDHILTTFKILDKECDEQISDDRLNITVTYENEGFYITNNGDVTLCGVELFVDYTNDDLSTGYHCDDIVGIRPNETRKIQNFEFEDINGNKYIYYPQSGPSKLLVQAEFAGCKNKVYSYLEIWE
jgi:hypothetical protein